MKRFSLVVNGKVINCTATRANYHAFVIGDECENIEFIGCTAKETEMLPYWWNNGSPKNIGGFVIDSNDQRFARNIVFRDCAVVNTNTPSTLGVGFSAPHANVAPEYGIKVINPEIEGAIAEFNNLQPMLE